jgi:hypothetical protein
MESSAEDKALHWVGILYRAMRSAGEMGSEEITIFTPDLLTRMRADDPHIDERMPFVLTYLARMWLEDPDVFVTKINSRLGTAYAVDRTIADAKFTLSP